MTDNSKQGRDLDDLFDRLPAALYRSSPTGEVLAANPATAELLGYASVETLLANPTAADDAYVDIERRWELLRLVEEHDLVKDFKVRLQRSDGTLIWVHDTSRTVRDESGNLEFYEGVLVDVTAEVEARDSASVLMGVIESASDLVVVFDDEQRLRYANGAALKFLGISDLARSTTTFSDLFGASKWADLTSALSLDRGWTGEVVLSDHAGRPAPLWAAVTTHQGRDNTTYVATIARDLSLLKRTQDRLEELVTAKDIFVATVSHELRNPLAGIMGLSEEMRDHFDDFGESERHDLITLIAHQAAEMTTIVDDLLVAARSDVGEIAIVPELIDMRDFVTRLAAGVSPSLDIEIPEEDLQAWADPQRLRQIVRNLISNAHRHGGDEIRLITEGESESVVVTVADNGPGVEIGDAERIFEAYQRAGGQSVKQGSVGLGLSVARRLARLMKGDLEYAYREGWATFTVTLPRAESVGVGAS